MAYFHSPIIGGATSGLTLYYDFPKPSSFPDGSSVVYNLGSNGINGTLTNSPTYTGRSKTASLDFDGVDDNIILSSTITFGNGNWTVGMWVNADSFTNSHLISNSSGGPVSNIMGMNTGKVYYRNYDGAWKDNYGNTSLSLSTWYYLTWVNYAGATAPDGTMNMFVNGISDSSIFNSYTTNGGPCNVIGRFTTNYFNGRISVVQIYNRALSSNEILLNFNSYKSRFGL